MKRRTLVLLAVAGKAAVLRTSALARPRAKLVAVLGASSPDAGGAFIEDLKRTLRELGWIEGRDIVY